MVIDFFYNMDLDSPIVCKLNGKMVQLIFDDRKMSIVEYQKNQQLRLRQNEFDIDSILKVKFFNHKKFYFELTDGRRFLFKLAEPNKDTMIYLKKTLVDPRYHHPVYSKMRQLWINLPCVSPKANYFPSKYACFKYETDLLF